MSVSAEIRKISSSSRAGVSIVSVELEDAVGFGKVDEVWSRVRDKVDDALMALFLHPLRDRAGKNAFLDFAAGLDNSQLMEIADDLRKLPMPVMIIRGEADIYLKPVISERLHREIPGSRFERIPTAGHFSPLDEPELHVDLIRDFLFSSTSISGSAQEPTFRSPSNGSRAC